MHEVSIVEELLNIVSEKALDNNLKYVDKIHIKVGELSGVVEEALRFAFDCISEDTIAKGCELVIERIEATARCNRCKITYKINHFNKLCPQCRSFCDSILSGHELCVYSIEGE
jgi:hydrogenase nickel incorporation protein HypA/HybF